MSINYIIYALYFQNEYIDSEWSVTLIPNLVRGIVLNSCVSAQTGGITGILKYETETVAKLKY